MGERDAAIRAMAMQWLSEQIGLRGETIPYRTLAEGFAFEGDRVRLVGPQGIFKPAMLADGPLTIMTAPQKLGRQAPYEDELTEDGRLIYRYRGTDPMHPDNVGLRRALELRFPLIYLFGVSPGEYEAVFPVYVTDDDPSSLAFTVELGVASAVGEDPIPYAGVKSYAMRTTLARLHQRRFSRQVIAAYGVRCAMCRLRQKDLLDAAHILPDSDPRSLPVVPNGISLCTLHHRAFDRHVMGITPNLKVEVREDILAAEDGPMLIHGLQGFQGSTLLVPRPPQLRPDPAFLEVRYELFRLAS